MDSFRALVVTRLGHIGSPTAATLATHWIRTMGIGVKESTDAARIADNVTLFEANWGMSLAGAATKRNASASLGPHQTDSRIVAAPTKHFNESEPDLSDPDSATGPVAPKLVGGQLTIRNRRHILMLLRRLQAVVLRPVRIRVRASTRRRVTLCIAGRARCLATRCLD